MKTISPWRRAGSHPRLHRRRLFLSHPRDHLRLACIAVAGRPRTLATSCWAPQRRNGARTWLGDSFADRKIGLPPNKSPICRLHICRVVATTRSP
jgi:hypothetical protein